MSSLTRTIQKRLVNNTVPVLGYEKPASRHAFGRNQIAFIGPDYRVTRENLEEATLRFPSFATVLEALAE